MRGSVPTAAFNVTANVNSHPSQHFEGADAVYEGGLLAVRPGHEVSHAARYGPGFPTEVGLVIDHHLQRRGQAEVKRSASKPPRSVPTNVVTHFRFTGVLHSWFPLW